MWQQFLANGIIAGSNIALVSVGYWVVFRTSRFFNFTYGAFFALGGYAFLVALDRGFPPLLSLILASCFLIATGLSCEYLVFSPLRQIGGGGTSLLIASIGLYVVAINCISLTFGDDIRSFRWWTITEGYSLWGIRFTTVHLWSVVASWMLILSVYVISCFSALGLRMRAVAADADMAHAQGLNVKGIRIFAMCLSAGLAGFAGILSSCEADIAPGMGLQPLLMAVVAVVIGENSIWRTAFAALCLGVFQHVGVIWIPTQWQETMPFFVLLAFFAFFPVRWIVQHMDMSSE